LIVAPDFTADAGGAETVTWAVEPAVAAAAGFVVLTVAEPAMERPVVVVTKPPQAARSDAPPTATAARIRRRRDTPMGNVFIGPLSCRHW